MSPEEFWSSSWYELNLRSRHYHLQYEQKWNHTRHIISALTGEKASKIMPLSFDTHLPKEAPSKEDQERIKNQWQHVLNNTPHG